MFKYLFVEKNQIKIIHIKEKLSCRTFPFLVIILKSLKNTNVLDFIVFKKTILINFLILQTEPPINTLTELSKAMRDSGLQLLVEVQSASQAMLEVRNLYLQYVSF